MKATQPTLPQAIKRTKEGMLDSLTSPESKRVYARGIDRFFAWLSERKSTTADQETFNKADVQAFRSHLVASGLSSSTINLYLTSVKRLAFEAADNGMLASEVASSITRVKGMKRQGVRTGNWLTVKQAEALIHAPDTNT